MDMQFTEHSEGTFNDERESLKDILPFNRPLTAEEQQTFAVMLDLWYEDVEIRTSGRNFEFPIIGSIILDFFLNAPARLSGKPIDPKTFVEEAMLLASTIFIGNKIFFEEGIQAYLEEFKQRMQNFQKGLNTWQGVSYFPIEGISRIGNADGQDYIIKKYETRRRIPGFVLTLADEIDSEEKWYPFWYLQEYMKQ